MNRTLSPRGFTLIELLVVISIIGLLSSVVLVSVNSARMKGRNAARIQEIKQLQTAFYLAAGTGTLWYPQGEPACVSATCYGWRYVADPATDAVLAPYIKKPVDPAGGRGGMGGFLYAGNTFTYLLESDSVPANCAPGYSIGQGADYTECQYGIAD